MDHNCRLLQGCNPDQFPNIPRLPGSQSHTHCHHLQVDLYMTHTVECFSGPELFAEEWQLISNSYIGD